MFLGSPAEIIPSRRFLECCVRLSHAIGGASPGTQSTVHAAMADAHGVV
jgi:hypothetical protein